MENFICNQYEEKLATSNTKNIKICACIRDLEKCNLFAFSCISAEYLQKIRIFNFPR